MDSISEYQTSLAMALWETPAFQTKDPISNEDSQNKDTTPAQCVECWTTNKDLRDLLPRGQLPLTAQVWVPRITCGPGARPEIQRSQDPWLWWCRLLVSLHRFWGDSRQEGDPRPREEAKVGQGGPWEQEPGSLPCTQSSEKEWPYLLCPDPERGKGTGRCLSMLLEECVACLDS